MGVLIIILFVSFCVITLALVVYAISYPNYDGEWEEATVLYDKPLHEVLAIIDDAECHGFEVKRVGTKIYFREMP